MLENLGKPWQDVAKEFQEMSVLPHQGVFHHKSLFEVHGKFDESFKIAGDYELLLRELKSPQVEPVFFPEIIVTKMGFGGVSSILEKRLEVLREFARARRKNKIQGFPKYWFWSYSKTLVRLGIKRCLGNKLSDISGDFYRKITGRSKIWTRIDK